MNHSNNRSTGAICAPAIFVCLLTVAVTIEFASSLSGPSIPLLIALAGTGFLLARRMIAGGLFVAGALIMWSGMRAAIDAQLPSVLEGRTLPVTGVITTVPSQGETSIRFRFAPHGRADLPHTLQLTWIESGYLPQIGEYWHLEVRLRRPRGLVNPGGFDYAGWLFREEIGATGIVVSDGDNRLVTRSRSTPVSRLRQRFNERMQARFPPGDARAVMLAVGSGTRQEISSAAWQRYAVTGTSHLVAVSGLHVGLAAGSAFLFTWMIAGALFRKRPVRDFALIVAAGTALWYAQVTGFAVPAQRAFLMFAMFALALLLRRRLCKWRILSLVGVAVLLQSPLSFLKPGFKMSFLAVAVIFFAIAVVQTPLLRFPLRRLQGMVSSMRSLLRIQCDLLLGLFPLTVLLFDRAAFAAPVVNLLVLPVFNIVAVPFCLFGMFLDGALEPVGDLFLGVAYRGVEWALAIIAWFAEIPALSIVTPELDMTLRTALWLPLLKVLMPPGWPGRSVAYVAIVAVTTHTPPVPRAGCLAVTVLDVGQGLAVVLRSADHVLLYDTGPAFRGGGNAATYVVVPFLRAAGIRQIDRLVVSHADIDHAGGLTSILRSTETALIIAGEEPQMPGIIARPCRAMEAWVVDGVEYRFLHPRNPGAWQGNNRSCVLLVTVGEHRLLLTGDIERPVELLLEYRDKLAAVQAAVVPHHGSATSSSVALIDAVQAELAIVSAAYGNRWGLPKPEVVARWETSGSWVVNTADSGAISLQYCLGENVLPPRLEREAARRIWHVD